MWIAGGRRYVRIPGVKTLGEYVMQSRHPQVAAFLRVIREAESSQEDVAYRMRWGGTLFDDLSRHPGEPVAVNGLVSTAAGAYQFLFRTWAEVSSAINAADFGHDAQDAGAVYLIGRRGALDDVIAGRLDEALAKCSHEWAGLPPARYAGQKAVSIERCMAVFLQYGGVLAGSVQTQPPAPVEDRIIPREVVPVNPLLLPVILQGLQAAIPIIGQFFAGDPKKAATAQAAGAVIDTVTKAVGAVNAQEALERVQTDEASRARAEEAIKAQFYELQTLAQMDKDAWARDEKSRGDARGFALAMIGSEGWRAIGFGALLAFLALVILLGGGLTLREVMTGEWADSQTKAGVVELIKAVVLIVVGYFFGSSSDSRRKTTLINER